jgi:glycine reductase
MKKILFYTNQFFGQIGGEDKASVKPQVVEGAAGAANLFVEGLEGEIVATVICGDNYYAENIEEARIEILDMIKHLDLDMLVAGPAFNAGRFGMACGDLCAFLEEELDIPTVTGMYHENPAVAIYKDKTFIVQTANSAAGMKKAVVSMVSIANKLLKGKELGFPEEEGYIPKGIRVNIFRDKTGAERALDMLVKKLKGEEFESEVPIPTYERVKPAKGIVDIRKAKIAILTSGGVVPMGNPDHLPAATAKFFKKYSLADVDLLEEGKYESVHAGYDPVYANKNPNVVLPIDLMKQKEKNGDFGSLYEYYYVTTGNSTSVADATAMGKAIAQELKEAGVQGAIMTST